MAVVLMPPTLIAPIYGMNFKIMPELDWAHGYPMALGMMLLAAVLPYFCSGGRSGCRLSATAWLTVQPKPRLNSSDKLERWA